MMSYQKISEIKKRLDYNLTEPEILIKLVRDAIKKGDKVQKDMTRLKRNTEKILKEISEENFILIDFSSKEEVPDTIVGIDGSFQLVGGAGGLWFAPISVARIIFKSGIFSQPIVDVFWAGIIEINEREEPKPNITASMRMLVLEANALLNWGSRMIKSLIYLDGPIVDPPVPTYGGNKYVMDRCESILKCLEKSILVGVVKRSRDKFALEYLIDKYPTIKNILEDYPSDQHLFAYAFSEYRRESYFGPLYTKWIEVTNTNPLYESYGKCGIKIYVVFYQKDVGSQVIRLDIPILNNVYNIEDIISTTIKCTDSCIYPNQNYPLPIILAHNKCNIRQGCAEVLYDEILSRSMSTDPRNQIIITQLR